MYKVAITGGIGSGKSKVVELLAQRGVAAYDCDSRAKALMASSPELREQIIECFGSEAYDGKALNRRYLAERVFNDKEALKKLNAIVHPAVMADFERWAEGEEGNYVVMESAILFEAGLEGSFDATVSVMAPEELRLERAMKRDGATEEQIRERMRNQLSDEERCDRSTFAIVNIELDDLEDDVEQLHRRLSYDSQPR